MLVKQGFGTYKELLDLDCAEILQMLEFTQISNEIQEYEAMQNQQ
ncbi:hypothetical protein [Francisella marina]|nr:hypothetical protein [Francisella marina]